MALFRKQKLPLTLLFLRCFEIGSILEVDLVGFFYGNFELVDFSVPQGAVVEGIEFMQDRGLDLLEGRAIF